MARTLLNGSEQIQAGSVPWSAMATGAIVPFASVIGSAGILLAAGTVSMTAALNLGGFTAQNSGSPSNASVLVTKAYVDAKTGGIGGVHDVQWYQNANVASLSGLSALADGTPVANDIILLTAQTTTTQNGPWVAAAGSWTRPTWWASATTVNEGQYFLIAQGTTYKDTKWWCTTVGAIVVDTTATAFSQDLSGSSYSNGTGLALAGSTFSVNYGTTSTTAAVGNDARITGALQTSALGTNVATALGVALGTGSGLAQLTSGVLQAAEFPALSGDVTSAGGTLTTTVNNTSSTGFPKYTNFVVNETPGGAMNGSNTSFTLANTPATGAGSVSTLTLELNGGTLEGGTGNDYTLSGSTITTLFAPAASDKLRAFYMK